MTTRTIGNQLFQFACTHCGRCCSWKGDVHLTDDDIQRLSRFTGLAVDEFIAQHTRLAYHRRGLSLLDREDNACIFLKDGRCSVYDARPDQCRRFPFPTTTPEDCPGLTPCTGTGETG